MQFLLLTQECSKPNSHITNSDCTVNWHQSSSLTALFLFCVCCFLCLATDVSESSAARGNKVKDTGQVGAPTQFLCCLPGGWWLLVQVQWDEFQVGVVGWSLPRSILHDWTCRTGHRPFTEWGYGVRNLDLTFLKGKFYGPVYPKNMFGGNRQGKKV